MSSNLTESITKFDVEFVLACKYSWDTSKKPTRLKASIGKLWDPSNDASINFASQLYEQFQRKSQDFGRLTKNTDSASMPERLNRHIKTNTPKTFENEFNEFLDKTLPTKLQASNLPDDFIVAVLQFSRYTEVNGSPDESSRENFFVVAMLRDKNALMFDDDMRAKSTLVINFTDLLQACRVDLDVFETRYVNGKTSDDNDMAFIAKGNAVRDYFYSACGIDSILKNKDSQENLKVGVDDFLFSTGLSRGERDDIKDKLYDFLKRKSKSGKPVTITDIQDELDESIPQKKKSFRGKLIKYLNDKGFEVNSEVKVTEKTYEEWLWVRVNRGDFQFKARKSDVGSASSQKPVRVKLSRDGKSAEVTVNYTIDDPESIETLVSAIK